MPDNLYLFHWYENIFWEYDKIMAFQKSSVFIQYFQKIFDIIFGCILESISSFLVEIKLHVH